MKKILIIFNISFRNKLSGVSGNEIRLAEIVRNWSLSGYQIHLWSGLAGKELFDGYKIKYFFHKSFTLKVDNQNKSTYILLISRLIFPPKSLWKFKGIVYTPTEGFTNVFPAAFLKIINKDKIKWACVVHWLPPLVWWKRRSNFFFALAFLLLQRSGFFLVKRLADIILPVSESTANQLKDVGIQKARYKTVLCGVNFDKIQQFTESINQEQYEAVCIKRLEEGKGMLDLVDIWRMVVHKIKTARLIIIGTGPLEAEMKKKIREFKLEKNIFLRGLILDQKKKFSELKKSKLFVLPSYEENWAIVIGEAMACGLPVLAYNLPELVMVWKKNFVHIPIGDKDFFAGEIIKYLSNRNLSISQGKMGFKYVKQFDWKKIALQEIKFIENS
ncbi:hypothetical protein A3D77_04400 [Candidatus Gottesmanbacteria bacterium RIFCSPHIGHO2_02_FULL_39_11]|uniref:Glycosyl transferase family 1 domain-containing protein n=1 Tax=Candidatus Gottesmanbacteria bacterium RIFCSPHIGHO2_02_FULL_39_11 TaxID=1798382 RepID=A0A1F5ZJQ2_9BACT|nr:MAG: hypothetical protein A3D77_04400 [Candidatus Gottesmanbacteria bacterium RIFCSPHIGHO2_02_FULL_39_11]